MSAMRCISRNLWGAKDLFPHVTFGFMKWNFIAIVCANRDLSPEALRVVFSAIDGGMSGLNGAGL
jgi:hypothetical protein